MCEKDSERTLTEIELKRVYVNMDCLVSSDGSEEPRVLYWKDGRSWKIDQILHITLPSENEFEGIRYTVLIGNAEKYIYRNNAGWYVVPAPGRNNEK